jgi:hypothetical protein
VSAEDKYATGAVLLVPEVLAPSNDVEVDFAEFVAIALVLKSAFEALVAVAVVQASLRLSESMFVAEHTAHDGTTPWRKRMVAGMNLALEPGVLAEYSYSLFRALMCTMAGVALAGGSVPEGAHMSRNNQLFDIPASRVAESRQIVAVTILQNPSGKSHPPCDTAMLHGYMIAEVWAPLAMLDEQSVLSRVGRRA